MCPDRVLKPLATLLDKTIRFDHLVVIRHSGANGTRVGSQAVSLARRNRRRIRIEMATAFLRAQSLRQAAIA